MIKLQTKASAKGSSRRTKTQTHEWGQVHKRKQERQKGSKSKDDDAWLSKWHTSSTLLDLCHNKQTSTKPILALYPACTAAVALAATLEEQKRERRAPQ